MEASKPYYVWLYQILELYRNFERSAHAMEEFFVSIIEAVYGTPPIGRLILWDS